MNNFLKQDLNRVFRSYSFWLGFFLTIGSCIFGIYPNIKYANDSGALRLFFYAHSVGSTSIYSLIAPLIAAIPYSYSYCIDKQSGFLNYIYIRETKHKYAISRIISNALAGGIVLALPLLIILISVCIFFPIKSAYLGSVVGAFANIFFKSQIMYIFILIVLSFIFGMIYATIGLAISAFTNNKYLAIVFPFFVYLIPAIIFPIFGLDAIEPSTTLIPHANVNTTESMIFIQLGLLLIISTVSFYKGVFRKGD